MATSRWLQALEARQQAGQGGEPPEAEVPGPAARLEGAAELTELRRLLGADQAGRVARLEERLDDPEWLAERLPEHLPVAFRRDPDKVADALYPVLGPAIRRSIQNTLSTTLETINRTVEHSLSRQGLLWRFEAWRTGVGFGELVLRNSLVYRVEQVFLIHRESGLPILHAVDPAVASQDSSLVAGMLTAIQDFVRDSFEVEGEDGLDTIRVGGLEVFVEVGPAAVLAAVVRGSPPEGLRDSMAEVLEELHGGELYEALVAFDGDSGPLEGFRPRVADLLDHRLKPRQAGMPRNVLLFWILVAVVGMAWAGHAVVVHQRWDRFRAMAQARPGVLVTRVDRGWFGGTTTVTGLLDPLAASPERLLGEAGLESDGVEWVWGRFLSLEPEIVLRRARKVLEPPGTVRLELYGEELTAQGFAPPEWRRQAAERSRSLPGVTRLRDVTQSGYDPSAEAPGEGR